MSATTQDRLKSLDGFKPVRLFSFQICKRKHVCHFYPKQGIIQVDDGSNTLVAVSYGSMTNSECTSFEFPKRDRVSRIVRKVKEKWKKMSKEDRLAFANKIPLNTMFFGGDYITG